MTPPHRVPLCPTQRYSAIKLSCSLLCSPVMHLDAPKDPYDLYFYTPDAWVPSHIATKQPPCTPPLPPKLPPPPRGGRPQRLEPLSPATLPNNFV